MIIQTKLHSCQVTHAKILYLVTQSQQPRNHESIHEYFFKQSGRGLYGYLRIWLNLPKKSMMENFIFLCSEYLGPCSISVMEHDH